MGKGKGMKSQLQHALEMYSDNLERLKYNLKSDGYPYNVNIEEYTDIVSKWGSTDPLSQIRPDPEEDKEYTNIVSKWSANADK